MALLFLIASQIYWILRAIRWGKRHIHARRARITLALAAGAVYLVLITFNVGRLARGGFFGHHDTPTYLTLTDALLTAPFAWWATSSIIAFLVVIVFWILKLAVGAAVWTRERLRKRVAGSGPAPPPVSSGRRQFLERAATLSAAVPFVAGAYGLLYGRLDLEITNNRVRLNRLPKAFHGFRIAQLSDIHIGPFMSQSRIRSFAEMANALKPDLIVLTGDFVTWDPSTQQAVVDALSGLKAPFGVFGCLGNHEFWSGTEDSITELFKLARFPMLRQRQVAITTGGETFNLIGVDPATGRRPGAGPGGRRFGSRHLEGVENLIAPDTVNILLSHYPDSFDRAAELGIDLTLSGHTHGGQVALDFISPDLAPCRLVTPYVAGWFKKPGGQLYVNRGIGTIGVPMRIGAPPEISVFELVRT